MTTDNDKGPSGSGQYRPKERSRSLDDETIEAIKAEVLGVGYKRPPKTHQFKKGQSGNPKGRPRKSEPLPVGDDAIDELFLRLAEEQVEARIGGEPKKMPAIEAVMRAMLVASMKGNALAQKHAANYFERASGKRAQKIRDRCESARNYVNWARREIAEREKKGQSIDDILPHPDDVVVSEEKGVRYVGPIDADELKQAVKLCKKRDVSIMQNELDRRSGVEGQDIGHVWAGSAWLAAVHFNRVVPKRMQHDETTMFRLARRAYLMPHRDLLKAVYRGWRSVGVHRRRGSVSLSLSPVLEIIKRVDEIAPDIAENIDNTDAVDFESYAEYLLEPVMAKTETDAE